jgi:molecular chaperone DnaK (HSP70)
MQGTTYSCVAVSRNGRVEIIPNKQGERTTASCVAFTADGRVLLGTPAKEQAESNPRNTGQAAAGAEERRGSCCSSSR